MVIYIDIDETICNSPNKPDYKDSTRGDLKRGKKIVREFAKVVKENKEYEIRKYSDRLVIETNSIEGNGFRKLFNYISGNNEKAILF